LVKFTGIKTNDLPAVTVTVESFFSPSRACGIGPNEVSAQTKNPTKMITITINPANKIL
jgi:hypothetical protein